MGKLIILPGEGEPVRRADDVTDTPEGQAAIEIAKVDFRQALRSAGIQIAEVEGVDALDKGPWRVEPVCGDPTEVS